jgi:alpha-tubulin suppressor-like RCC1 family protein
VVDIIHSSPLVVSYFIKTTENGLYSFGNNRSGQLGIGNTVDQSTPTLVSFLKNEKIKSVVCGGHHTIIWTGNLILFE